MANILKDIAPVVIHLQQGNLAAIPTETVYGLAANALNPEAVTKIFEVKGRPAFDPLIVHITSIFEVDKYAAEFPDKAQQLAREFWPGPLTLLLPKKKIIPDLITAGLGTVGLRCPNHHLTSALLKQLDFPLAAPSANPFGYVSPTSAQHVQDQLGDKIEFILDGGPCEVGLESTIAGFEGEDIVIHRLGGLSIEVIEAVVGKVKLRLNASSNPKAPGQLSSHYATTKKMIIGNLNELLIKHEGEHVGLLSFKTRYPSVYSFVLSPAGSLQEAAQNIFCMLRKLDQSPVDKILTEYVPDVGIGRAINDRLKRSATINIIQ